MTGRRRLGSRGGGPWGFTVLDPFSVDGAGEDGGGGCAVTISFVFCARSWMSGCSQGCCGESAYRAPRFSSISFKDMAFTTVTPSSCMDMLVWNTVVSSNTRTLSNFGTPVRLIDDYIMPCKKHSSRATPCWIETAYPWGDTDSFCKNIDALDSENGSGALVGEFDDLVKSSREPRVDEGSVGQAAAWRRVHD
jgi:hypothetical protein